MTTTSAIEDNMIIGFLIFVSITPVGLPRRRARKSGSKMLRAAVFFCLSAGFYNGPKGSGTFSGRENHFIITRVV